MTPHQGDKGNGMYFVETGTLVVLKQIDGEEKEVKHAAEGKCFNYSLKPPGERASSREILRRTRFVASRSQTGHSGG